MLSDTYRDHRKHCVHDSGSYGGVDGLSDTSFVKYAGRVVKDLNEQTEKEILLTPVNISSCVYVHLVGQISMLSNT